MAAKRFLLAFFTALALLPLDAACSSSSSDGDAAGDDDSSPCGSDVNLCAAQSKDCGSLGVVDTCGNARTVVCGDCTAPLSCGGSGTANVCGASCVQGCPSGFTCDNAGVCTGGSAHGLGIDVKSVHVSGKVTLDGGSLGDGAHCAGGANATDPKLRLAFDDPTSGATFTADVLCSASDGAFSTDLEPGTYQVSAYSVYSDATNVPSGTFVITSSFEVTGTTAPAAFDLKTTPISGKVTLDGGPLGDGAHCAGGANATDPKLRVSFLEATTSASFTADVLCSATDGSFSTRVSPGTYKVVAYTVYSDATNVPEGTFVLSPSLKIDASNANASLDIKTVALSGKVTLDGGPLGDGAHCAGGANATDPKLRVSLLDATAGASFTADVLCSATDGAFSTRVAPGTYRVTAYTVYSDATNAPNGTFALNPAFAVSAGNGPAAFNLKTVALSGKLTLNGAALAQGAHCVGGANPTDPMARLEFSDSVSHASFTADVPCSATDGSYTTRVGPGTYVVSAYSVYSDASNLPQGTFVVNPSFTVGSGAGNFDLRTIHADGKLTLNGAALTDGAHCTGGANATDPKARLTFVDATAAPTFSFLDSLNAPPKTSVTADVTCGAANGAFSVDLPAGIYRVSVYSVYTDASNLPEGTFTAVSQIDLH